MIFISQSSLITTWSSFFLFVFGQCILGHDFNASGLYCFKHVLFRWRDYSIFYPIGRWVFFAFGCERGVREGENGVQTPRGYKDTTPTSLCSFVFMVTQ